MITKISGGICGYLGITFPNMVLYDSSDNKNHFFDQRRIIEKMLQSALTILAWIRGLLVKRLLKLLRISTCCLNIPAIVTNVSN